VPLAPDAFYRDSPAELISQGDVFLAPWTMAWSAETEPAAPLVPVGPMSTGARSLVPAWTSGPGARRDAPAVTLATTWAPVVVLSHDCEIDKEFNEHLDALIAQGADPDEAAARASQRDDLDRYILVSPLLPYRSDIVAEAKWAPVRAKQKIGYVGFPPMPAVEHAEFCLHLSRISTIERRLLRMEFKIASLTEPARALLRFKLAEALASRNLSLVSRLEAAIGRRIDVDRTLKVKRQDASLALVLDDGSELLVGAKADVEPAAPERTRKA
jgi:hypothetical protein